MTREKRVLIIGGFLAVAAAALAYNYWAPHASTGEKAARGGSSGAFIIVLLAAGAARRRRRQREEEEGRNG